MPKNTAQNDQQIPNGSTGGNQGQMFSRLEHDVLCKKLIESVEMIKDLHANNKMLRENIQAVQQNKDKGEGENYQLQHENRDLRDRIEILESVIGSQTYDVQQDAWRDLLYPSAGGPPSSTQSEASTDMSTTKTKLGSSQGNPAIQQMANELIEFRKGSGKQMDELAKLQTQSDEAQVQNLQLIQQNKVLEKQLMQLQERQMKSNQMAGIYGGPTVSYNTGKKMVSNNVNVNK